MSFEWYIWISIENLYLHRYYTVHSQSNGINVLWRTHLKRIAWFWFIVSLCFSHKIIIINEFTKYSISEHKIYIKRSRAQSSFYSNFCSACFTYYPLCWLQNELVFRLNEWFGFLLSSWICCCCFLCVSVSIFRDRSSQSSQEIWLLSIFVRATKKGNKLIKLLIFWWYFSS